jgi:hypothetical protein
MDGIYRADFLLPSSFCLVDAAQHLLLPLWSDEVAPPPLEPPVAHSSILVGNVNNWLIYLELTVKPGAKFVAGGRTPGWKV